MNRFGRLASVFVLLVAPSWAFGADDEVSVDLTVPAVTDAAPAPGTRVRQFNKDYVGSRVYHTLYLPTDWKPDRKYPVIVEYAGNKLRTTSLGTVEGSSLGYGVTGGKGVNVVYDSVGKDTWDGSLSCLAPFCLMASFGNASGPVDPIAPGILGPKGSLYLTRQTLFTHISSREATQAMADDLFAVVSSGAVKIVIDQRYPLKDVAQAHRDLEARKTTGSTILTV